MRNDRMRSCTVLVALIFTFGGTLERGDRLGQHCLRQARIYCRPRRRRTNSLSFVGISIRSASQVWASDLPWEHRPIGWLENHEFAPPQRYCRQLRRDRGRGAIAGGVSGVQLRNERGVILQLTA